MKDEASSMDNTVRAPFNLHANFRLATCM